MNVAFATLLESFPRGVGRTTTACIFCDSSMASTNDGETIAKRPKLQRKPLAVSQPREVEPPARWAFLAGT